MRKMYGGKTLVVLSVVVMMVGSSIPAVAQSPESDIFGVIHVKNPQELLPTIAQFVDTFQPGMGGMVNSMMVGNSVFFNPQWTGMDMTGEYTIVVLNPMKYAQAPFAVVFPLTSQDEYLGAVSQTLTGGEDVDGIYTFTKPTQQNMFVTFAGDAGIMSDSQDVAAQVKGLLESESAALQETMKVKGQITGLLAMQDIFTALKPTIEMFKQQMLSGMQQGMAEGEKEGMPPAAGMTKIVQTEIDMVLGLVEQTQKAHIGISFEENGLRLSDAVFPVSGTSLEQFMAAQTPTSSSLLGLMPGDAGILASGAIELTPKFIERYLEFTKVMMSATPEADVQKAMDLGRQYFEIFGGDFAFSGLSQSQESLFVQVMSVKDPAKAKQLIEEYPDMFNTMSNMYKSMGLDMSLSLADKTEVKGGELFTYQFDMDADMLPDPQAQEAFNKVFGENISVPMGFAGEYLVSGFGKNPGDVVKAIMETLDSGAETTAQVTPSQYGLPEENNVFMYLSVPKIMKWVAQIAPEAPAFEIVEGPGIGMTSRFAESHVEGEMMLPVEEIQAIQEMIMQAQMQRQQQLQQQQQQ